MRRKVRERERNFLLWVCAIAMQRKMLKMEMVHFAHNIVCKLWCTSLVTAFWLTWNKHIRHRNCTIEQIKNDSSTVLMPKMLKLRPDVYHSFIWALRGSTLNYTNAILEFSRNNSVVEQKSCHLKLRQNVNMALISKQKKMSVV